MGTWVKTVDFGGFRTRTFGEEGKLHDHLTTNTALVEICFMFTLLVLTIRPLFNQLSLFSTMSINLEVCLKKQRSRCIVLGCEPRISRFRSDHSTNCVMPLLLNRSELSENLQFFTPKQINPLACCDCNKELCLFT